MSLKLQKKPVEVEFRPEGYAVLESHHEEVFFMDWRRDPFPKILMFIGGEGILEMRDSRLAIRSPSVYVIPKGRKHRIVDSRGKPLSLYGICIHSPRYPSQTLVRSACSKLRAENDPRRVQRIEGWLRQLLAEERLQPANFEDAQLCLITWILIELARTSSADTVQIPGSRHRVDAYISSLASEFWKTEDIDSVARTLGLSRRRFTQLFREISGESWQRRVTRLRMKYAGELLRTSSVSIRSIAFECGYKDLSHFYRVFRQYNGVSPGQYRKR